MSGESAVAGTLRRLWLALRSPPTLFRELVAEGPDYVGLLVHLMVLTLLVGIIEYSRVSKILPCLQELLGVGRSEARRLVLIYQVFPSVVRMVLLIFLFMLILAAIPLIIMRLAPLMRPLCLLPALGLSRVLRALPFVLLRPGASCRMLKRLSRDQPSIGLGHLLSIEGYLLVYIELAMLPVLVLSTRAPSLTNVHVYPGLAGVVTAIVRDYAAHLRALPWLRLNYVFSQAAYLLFAVMFALSYRYAITREPGALGAMYIATGVSLGLLFLSSNILAVVLYLIVFLPLTLLVAACCAMAVGGRGTLGRVK